MNGNLGVIAHVKATSAFGRDCAALACLSASVHQGANQYLPEKCTRLYRIRLQDVAASQIDILRVLIHRNGTKVQKLRYHYKALGNYVMRTP